MINLATAGLTELKLEQYRMYLHYTGPEILNGSEGLSKAADVFSFAMVMVEVRCRCLSWSDLLFTPDIGFQS